MTKIGSGHGLFVYIFVGKSGGKFGRSFGCQFLWSCEQQIHFVPKNVRLFLLKTDFFHVQTNSAVWICMIRIQTARV